MSSQKTNIIAGIVVLLAVSGAAYYWFAIRESDKAVTTVERGLLIDYIVQQFNLSGITTLSQNQLNQHLKLYAGYVKKRNEILHNLQTVNRTNSANRTYSPFRSLKLAETYAVNGSLLHELYFENISKSKSSPGPLTTELLETNFGSLEAFKQDFIDCGGCSRGWVVTSYSINDGCVYNYVLEEHNQHVPVLTVPLLVLDVYEHAYMIDFGIDRNPYLTVFWDLINWDAVEQRIEKWVNRLKSH